MGEIKFTLFHNRARKLFGKGQLLLVIAARKLKALIREEN